MKAVVAAFNQEKALVGAFSVITNLRMELFEALVEDPRPTLQSFKIMMEGVAPYPEDRKRGAGDIHGIVFQNISIAARSVLGEPEMLWGMEDGLIYGLVFDNVTIGGDKVEGVEYFYRNEFVFN